MYKRASLLALCAAFTANCFALSFDFSYDSGIKQEVLSDFQKAAGIWSSHFNDNVTVRLNIDYSNSGAGFLGAAGSNYQYNSYSSVRGALVADSSTANDATAVSHLNNSQFAYYLNRTAEAGGNTPYYDANSSSNNLTMGITTANAKALGLRDANDVESDGYITFNSYYDSKFVFGESGAIGTDQVSFLAVAIHEIGHQLGFVSGVDDLDYYPGYSEDAYAFTTLDLYRYADWNGSLVNDLSADNREKDFSIDGSTVLGKFSRGVNNGDGWQASHWEHHEDLASRYGIMDPRALRGAFYRENSLDVEALDVIGWNPTPEPGTLVACGLGLIALARRRKKA